MLSHEHLAPGFMREQFAHRKARIAARARDRRSRTELSLFPMILPTWVMERPFSR